MKFTQICFLKSVSCFHCMMFCLLYWNFSFVFVKTKLFEFSSLFMIIRINFLMDLNMIRLLLLANQFNVCNVITTKSFRILKRLNTFRYISSIPAYSVYISWNIMKMVDMHAVQKVISNWVWNFLRRINNLYQMQGHDNSF